VARKKASGKKAVARKSAKKAGRAKRKPVKARRKK